MISTNITVRVISDSRRVLSAIDRKSASVLARTGAYASQVIRRNVRRRKKTSAPGQLPSHHAPGESGLKFTGFVVNRADKSVIAGPVKYTTRGTIRPARSTVPHLVNDGGAAINVESGTRINYSPRPYVDRAVGPSIRFFKSQLRQVPLE